MSNKELAEELHKRYFDLADTQLISKFIKEFVFYYVLLIFSVNILGLFL